MVQHFLSYYCYGTGFCWSIINYQHYCFKDSANNGLFTGRFELLQFFANCQRKHNLHAVSPFCHTAYLSANLKCYSTSPTANANITDTRWRWRITGISSSFRNRRKNSSVLSRCAVLYHKRRYRRSYGTVKRRADRCGADLYGF